MNLDFTRYTDKQILARCAEASRSQRMIPAQHAAFTQQSLSAATQAEKQYHERHREFRQWQVEFMRPYREAYEAERELAEALKQMHRALRPVLMIWTSIQELATPEEREALMTELEQLAPP